jgi:2-polyprenyl-3-methyl-5-hydroxy-6-metoxy-1,4-benzoquinol methylase
MQHAKICELCQQTELVFKEHAIDYLSERSFELWYCPHCESYQTRGNFEKAEEFYGTNYYGSQKGKFLPFIEKIFHWNHRRNALFFYHKFKPSKVLEIGCGRAYILKELKTMGVDVYCLESATAADWILNNPDVKVVPISEHHKTWHFQDNSFDLVILWHVFEHLTQPVEILKEIHRILSPNQTICISVPNVASLQARINLTTWFHLDVPRHLFHFSEKGLIKLLENNGYEITEIQNGDALQNLYGWFQSLANLSTKPMNNLLYRFIQGGQPWKSCSKKWLLIPQILSSIIWLPLGLLGYGWEIITKRPAIITIYARKKL